MYFQDLNTSQKWSILKITNQLVCSMYKVSAIFNHSRMPIGQVMIRFCQWHHHWKQESRVRNLRKPLLLMSPEHQVMHVTGDRCILIAGPLCLSTLQVYGAVAWSTDTASSGAGCLPGSGIVPQTLWAWSAAGAQGNWHLLPRPGVLLWSPGTAHLTSPHLAAEYIKLVTLRRRTREPSGQREFPPSYWNGHIYFCPIFSLVPMVFYSCFHVMKWTCLWFQVGIPNPGREGLVLTIS